MIFQCGSDLLGCRADVNEKRALVGNQRRGGKADVALFRRRDEAPRLIRKFSTDRGNHRPAVRARQDPKVAECVVIAADSLWCDLETGRQLVDCDPPDGPG